MTMGRFRNLGLAIILCSTLAVVIQLRDLFQENQSTYMAPPVLVRPSPQGARDSTLHTGSKQQRHHQAQQQSFSIPTGPWQSSSKFRFIPAALTRIGAAFDFCPRAYGPKVDKLRPPTITLTPIGGGLEPAEAELGRTTYIDTNLMDNQNTSEVGFLPWKLHEGETVPRFVSSAGFNDYNGLVEVEERVGAEGWKAPPCLTYSVPASSSTPPLRKDMSRFMFGMSTAPDRIITSIPVWEDWLASVPYDQPLPLILVLVGQKESESDWAWEAEQQLLASRKAGTLDVLMKVDGGVRMERRYLALVKQMWLESRAREEMREGDGLSAQVDWFVLADDDTYFLGLPALSKAVESYDPAQPYIVGSLSENQRQVTEWGRIAYGGASIILSRGLVEMINTDGNYEKCQEKFGYLFGGDAMITSCAALVMGTTEGEVVTQLPILHQFDIEHDASGLLQAGWRFSTLHHWKSWMELFPIVHPNTVHDPVEAVRLVGKVARAIGASNWGRRYVWGLPPGRGDVGGKEASSSDVTGPTAIIALGYSVTLYAPGAIDRIRLNAVERTFTNTELFATTRENIEEGVMKRTYFLVDAQILSYIEGTGRADALVMRHVDADGQMMDIIWDARAESKKAGFGRQIWQGVKGRVQGGWK